MSDERGYIDLPLMAGEEVDASFGERRGLDAEAAGDHNAIVLTDRRLLRLSRSGAKRDVSFASLRDVHLAEVRRTSRGMRSVWRAALLLAGAGAALATISYLPIAAPLAAALLLGAAYHLFHHVTVSQEGIILFHAGQEQMGIAYRGNLADQAYAFVNRLFHLKEALSIAPEESGEEPTGLGAPGWEIWHEMEDAEMGVASSRGDDTPEEPGGEDVSQMEPHGEPTPMDEAATKRNHLTRRLRPRWNLTVSQPLRRSQPPKRNHLTRRLRPRWNLTVSQPLRRSQPPKRNHLTRRLRPRWSLTVSQPLRRSQPPRRNHLTRRLRPRWNLTVSQPLRRSQPPQEEPPYAEAPPTMEPHGEPTPAEESAAQEELPYAEAPPTMEPHGEPTPAEESAAQRNHLTRRLRPRWSLTVSQPLRRNPRGSAAPRGE